MSETVAETESIGRKAGRGLGWGLLGNGVTKIGSFATSLALTRLLVPHDFGVYAVALAAMQFVIHINDLGLIPATIQWRGKLEEMAPSAATIAGGFSFLLYGGFWFTAPAFAQFAGAPEATPVIRLFTATILIDGITAVQGAYLLRTFQQRRYVMANAAGIVANAIVAIGLALAGVGPMALASGQIASAVTTGALILLWAGLPIRIGIDKAVARKLLAYGLPLAAGLGIESILEQSDKVVVGHLMGAAVLGLYLLASNVSNWAPGMIGTAVRIVSLPGYARMSEKDEETLSQSVSRTLPLLFLVTVPIAVLIAVLASPMILLLYGRTWLPAADPLRYLMILMVVRMVTGLCMDVLMSTTSTRWTLYINLGWVIAAIPGLWLGAKAGGGVGAAVAQAVVAVLVALPLAGLALSRVGVRLRPLLRQAVRPLLAGALAGVVAYLLHHALLGTNSFIQLAVAGTAGLLAYAVSAVSRADAKAWLAAVRPGRPSLDPAG